MYRMAKKLWATGALLAVVSAGAAQGQPVDLEQLQPSESLNDPQTTSPPKTGGRASALMDEIVVTAQKREQGMQDVGVAVSAFSGEQLQQIGVNDTTDLGDMIPGFNFSQAAYGVPVYTLRGVGFNETAQAASSTVGVYLDEMNIPYPSMTVGANLDIQRVEVVKGPQGTLYGRNTTGGAINYIANRSGEAFEAGIKADLGSFWRTDIEGFISGPVSDRLGLRFALRDTRSQEGWQYDYTRGKDFDYGLEDRTAARLIVDYEMSDRVDVSFTVNGWRDASDPQSPQFYAFRNQAAIPIFEPSPEVQNHQLAPEDDNRATALGPNNEPPHYLEFGSDNWYLSIMGRLDWDIEDDTTFTLLLSHQQIDIDSVFNADGLTVSSVDTTLDSETDAQALEARLSGVWGDEITWVGGLWASQDTVDESDQIHIDHNSSGNGGVIIRYADLTGYQEAQTYAAFGQGEWQATEELKFTIGTRYTWEERESTACVAGRDGDYALLFNAVSLLEQSGLTPTIGTLIGADGGNEVQDALLDTLRALLPPTSSASAPLGDVLAELFRLGITDAAGNVIGGIEAGDCFVIDNETKRPGPYSDTLTEDNISLRLAVDWTPDEDTLIYASFAVGYKSGSFTILPASNTQQLEPVSQEQLIAYEVGAKTDWFDRQLTVNAAAFYYDYKDKQLQTFYNDPLFGPLLNLANVPESRVAGAEVEARGVPIEYLFLSLSAAYTYTEVIEFEGIVSDGRTEDFAGNKFAYAPAWELALLANYDIPMLGNYLLTLGTNMNYASSTEGELSNDPEFKRSGYFLIDGRLVFGPDDGQWKFTLYGRNLTDETYYTSQTRWSDIATRFTGGTRRFGVSLSYHLN